MKITEKTLIFPIEKRVTNSCHASTVCAADNGDILAAWFGGEHEKADDVEIYLSRRDKSSGIWTEPRMISVKDNIACWNPVLFKIDGKIVLCYKKGSSIPEWKTLVRYSYDEAVIMGLNRNQRQSDGCLVPFFLFSEDFSNQMRMYQF